MFLVEYCHEDRIYDCKNGYHEFCQEVVDLDSIYECVDWVCDELEFARENAEKYYFMVYRYSNGGRDLVFEGNKADANNLSYASNKSDNHY